MRVLERVDRLHVGRVVGVHERPDRQGDVPRADLLSRERVRPRRVEDIRGVVVLVDDLHRHVPLARVRERDGDRRGVEVEHAERVEGVAVQADHRLVVDGREFALVVELAEPAVLDEPPEVRVGLGAAEVVDRHPHGSGLLCRAVDTQPIKPRAAAAETLAFA